MRYKEAKRLVSSPMSDLDKVLNMMEALHEVAHDTLIERMQKDLKQYGIEGE